MSNAPYGVRLLVGVAATAVEETLKLPQTILTYPMTVASQVAHLVMKVQQDVATLVIKGDAALESLFPPRDEQPEWATFDEDEDAADPVGVDGAEVDDDAPTSTRLTEGRFALYSMPDSADADAGAATDDRATPGDGVTPPAIADEIDYSTLTLAQLRARLQSLAVGELEELLAYEEATKSRAPFQTLLANRITRALAK
ncbi:MAG TPA: lipid droplet-associated protein [Mycobacterium sp.]|nr:lipid droplet-associated protein [Mycobacterium sp.]